MFAVSALIPSGSGSTLVTKVLGQIKADAPVLLVVLAGVVAISMVIHLLLRFIRRPREFDENYKLARDNGLDIDESYEYAQAIEDEDYFFAERLMDNAPIDDTMGEDDGDDGSAGVKRALGEFDTEYAKSEAMLDDLEAFNRRLRRGV